MDDQSFSSTFCRIITPNFLTWNYKKRMQIQSLHEIIVFFVTKEQIYSDTLFQALQSCDIVVWEKAWEKFRRVTKVSCSSVENRKKRVSLC